MSSWVWLVLVAVFTGYEFFSLSDPEDEHRPFTNHVRDLMKHAPWLRGVAALFIGWLFFHFVIDS